MPDYDLTGLSPRSFEQLIQAVALQEVSPKTIIFGDGTDGGREATFQGKTNYNSGDEPWDGYIVFQAKFCQRPTNDTKRDGDWAIAQLKKELEDFADPKRKRKKPDYYIFITNVVLTPVLEKGSKDRAYKVFEEYQNTVPLKEYDIWDYDKICRFIDANADIRRTYAAWITPGDVLSQVIEMLSLSKADFKTVISSFLKKELLSDLYANLEQAGHSTEDKIPLASVFVDLPVARRQISEASTKEQQTNIVASLVENARRKFDYDSLFSGHDRNTLIHGGVDIKQVQKIGKWVIIGGPGQGKTTVGQFLCQLFRAAILKDVENLRDLEVEQSLSKFESQCKRESICFPKARRFPLRIVLNEFAAVLASNDSVNSVLDYIAWYIHKRTSRNINVEDIRQWLANYPWLIVLDGLDEVPASSNRHQVLTAIRDFSVDANEVNADIMIVATTRPQGYNDDFNTDFYRHVWLAPLSKEQALHYARRLLGLRYENDSDRQSKIISRLERAANDNFTSRLMQSPLQVTIMTVLLNKTGQAPKDRWSLFNKYYDIIYDREVERDIPASEILRDYKSDIDSIHFQVGLLLQVQSEHSGKTDARLSVEDFTTLVRSRLEAEGHEGKECVALTRQIIEAAANRLVFLVGLEQNIVGFEVRSLQEFMASEAIMNGSDEQIRNRLKEIIPIISWRNVALFAVGKCFARNEKEHLRSFIYTECAALNDLDEFNSACLSGSRLALDILEDGSVTHKPKFLKLFARLALRLLDIPPDNFHIRLANVCIESIFTIYKDEIEARIKNIDCYQSFGAWNCLLQLINLDLDWAIKIGDIYWFRDLHQQLRVISCFLQLNVNIIDPRRWIAKKVDYFLPRISPVIAGHYFPWYEETLFALKIDDTTNKFISALELQRTDTFFCDIEHNHHIFPNFCNGKNTNNTWALSFIPSIDINGFISEDNFLLFPTGFFPQLLSIEYLHNYWIAYGLAIHFWFNPNRETLYIVLKYVAKNYDSELINWIVDLVPWQIYECLLAAKNRQELFEIAESAKFGKLEIREDWKSAEKRWNQFGIDVDDFVWKSSNIFTFNPNLSNQGFPFKKSYWTRYSTNYGIAYNYEPVTLFENLANLYLESNNIDAIKTISDLIIYLLGEDDNQQKIINQQQIEEKYNLIKQAIDCNVKLRDYCVSSEKIEIIFSIYKINKDRDLLNLINLIGQKADFEYYITFDRYEGQFEIYKELAACFQQNCEFTGILNIISYLYPDQKAIQLLSTINLNTLNEDKFKEAAIIISLAQENYLKNNLVQIIDNSIQLASKYPRVIPRIILMIEKKLFSSAVTENLLEQLHFKLPRSHWEYLSRLDKLINQQLTNKTSKLNNQNKWSQLGLPPGGSILLSRI